jgi:membrane-associated phospholipid phosphatase
MPDQAHNVSTVQIRRWYLCITLILTTIITFLCPRDSLAQTGESSSDARYGLATVDWNMIARNLVSSNALDPVSASRVYALLSIAQNDAVVKVEEAERQGSVGSWAPLETVVRVAVTSSSIAVLSELFSGTINQLTNTYDSFAEKLNLTKAPGQTFRRAAALGQDAAERVLRRARGDGSDRDSEVVVPGGVGHWRTEPDRPPLRPYWGQVRPFLMESVDRFVAKPPPTIESPSFRLALAEVKTLARQLDTEQWELVLHWADGAGTPTPPGHWNEIAAELIVNHGLSERSAARTFALLNIALFDAGIACWMTKYTYWLARPNQMDPEIKPNIAVPNFPSYTSGHATFSAAAAEVLSHLFPGQAKGVWELAEEAAMSRVYAGIHFEFDSDEGVEIGHRIGLLAAELGKQPGELLPHLR